MLHTLTLRRLRQQGFTVADVPTRHGALQAIQSSGPPDGPAIALVHGVSGRATVFSQVAQALQPIASKLLIPDLLGHGESTVPSDGLTLDTIQESLDEVLLHAMPEGALLVGVSMGGMLAARHAGQHADRLSGLMLCNPGGAPMGPEAFEHTRRLLTPSTHWDARRLAAAALGSRSGWFHHAAAPGLLRRLQIPHIQDFVAAASHLDCLSAAELRALTLPIRLLIGEADTLLPPGTSDWYATNLPAQGATISLPGIGHVPMFESPHLFTAHVLDFVADLRRPAADDGV